MRLTQAEAFRYFDIPEKKLAFVGFALRSLKESKYLPVYWFLPAEPGRIGASTTCTKSLQIPFIQCVNGVANVKSYVLP